MTYGELLDAIEERLSTTPVHYSVEGRIKDLATHLGVATEGKLIVAILDDIRSVLDCHCDSKLISNELQSIYEHAILGKSIIIEDSTGENLSTLTIKGQTEQDGTPSPANRLDLESVGTYNVTTTKYDIPIKISHNSDSVTKTFSLDEPLRKWDTLEAVSGIVTRLTKEIIFDGTETWEEYSAPGQPLEGHCYFIWLAGDSQVGYGRSLCTHFKNVRTVWSRGHIGEFGDHQTYVYKYFISDKETVADWKAWLAEQYAAGTPVIIDYETAATYTTQSEGQTIPTYEGETTITVVASVEAAEITAEY